MLTLEHADWRRILVASAVTMVALPSLWLMNRDDGSGAPNVATAGVVVSPDATGARSDDERRTDLALGIAGGAFLEGPSRIVDDGEADPADSVVAIAVPAPSSGAVVNARATYRSTFADPRSCLVRGAPYAARITVTNLDNGRRTTCTATVSPVGSRDDVVLHTSTFVEIANLTDAPVPVELNW